MNVTQLQSLLPLFLLVVVFYFLIMRPQQVQQKKRQAMLGALRKGDRVVTIGGIFGTVTEVKDDHIRVRIADKVEVEMAKAGIDHVRSEGPKSEKGKGKPEEEEGKAED